MGLWAFVLYYYHKCQFQTKPHTTDHLTLRIKRILPLLVLCYFVGLMLATLLIGSPVGFRNIYHVCKSANGVESLFLNTFIDRNV